MSALISAPIKLMEKGMTSLDKRTPPFSLLAKSTCEITFGSDTEAAFELAEQLIARFDEIFDDPGLVEQREQAVEELAFALGIMPDYQMNSAPVIGDSFELATSLRALISEAQAKEFFQTGLETISVTSQLKEATRVADYIVLRRRESQLTRLMLFSLIPDSDKQQPNFSEYEKFITGGWGMGNLLDSAIDLPHDHRDGITNINPTVLNRLRLFGSALMDTKDTFAYFGVARSVGIIHNLLRDQKEHNLYLSAKQ
jgi:hypothetical protein